MGLRVVLIKKQKQQQHGLWLKGSVSYLCPNMKYFLKQIEAKAKQMSIVSGLSVLVTQMLVNIFTGLYYMSGHNSSQILK